MHISRLLSGLIGSKEPAEPKVFELKVGEVVRGLVLQMLTEHDALLQISGTLVRARLETPLAQGQATLLQVQPESTAGQIMLKPLKSSAVPIAEDSLAEMAKSFGLKDTEINRSLIRELHAASIPINSKTIASFRAVIEAVPSHAHVTDWTESAMIAARKGLPLKAEIVGALHQTLFGKPLAHLLGSLSDELRHNTAVSNSVNGANTDTNSIAHKLLNAISQWNQLQQIMGGGQQHAANETKVLTQAQAGQPQVLYDAGNAARNGSALNLPKTTYIEPVSLNLSAPTDSQTKPHGNLPANLPSEAAMMQNTKQAQQTITSPVASQTTPTLIAAVAENTGKVSVQSATTPVTVGVNSIIADEFSVDKSQLNVGTKEPLIISLLKHIGLDYENKVANVLGQASPETQQVDSLKESVKGLILQLLRDESLQPAIKEVLQQTLQHITGQQLLLGTERGNAFSFITMMIPTGQQENGSEHATVQIQSRKNGRGQFDANNCRLLFDLRMNQLGELLVDVHVTNRIVSLQVHNSHPHIGPLLEAAKPEVEAALAGLGYSFISMKVLPYPNGDSNDSGDLPRSNHPIKQSSAIGAMYRSKPYKGVDMRI